MSYIIFRIKRFFGFGNLDLTTDNCMKYLLAIILRSGDKYGDLTGVLETNGVEYKVKFSMERIEKEYPDHETEVHSGGQPHYQFILSIE